MIVIRSGQLRLPGGPAFGFVRSEILDGINTGPEAPAMFGKTLQQLPSHVYEVTVARLSPEQMELIRSAFEVARGRLLPLMFSPDTGPVERAMFASDSLAMRYQGPANCSCTFELEVDPR